GHRPSHEATEGALTMTSTEEITYPESAPDIAPGLGARLKAIRIRIGCSQKKMGPLLSIGTNSWPRYENGEQIPGGKVLAALAREGFNVNWVLTGEGPMETEDHARAVEHTVVR